MKAENIKAVKEEMKRLTKRINEFESSREYENKASGAVKRASMDLTRALAKLRNDK